MSCPYFRQEYVGICASCESPHIPSIAELERYCFRGEFGDCPLFRQSPLRANKEQRYCSSVRTGFWNHPQITR